MKNICRKKGFTLIELLVVATIIVILTVIAVLNYGIAEAKARDGQRKSDLTKISLALSNYYADQKLYPKNFINLPVVFSNASSLSSSVSSYLPTIPTDPLNDSTHYYQYASDGNQYKLTALSESIKSTDTNAQTKAGDYYNPVNVTLFQISSSATALNWQPSS